MSAHGAVCISGYGGNRSREGFVLAGGGSTRMGRDKAFLPLEGSTLIEQIAARVLHATGAVTLVGPREPYRRLGYPMIEDRVKGCGPLGGVYSALSITQADWNLILACDMPGITTDLLETLLRTAEATGSDCVVPETAAGLHPLCAVYHRRCRDLAGAAIARNALKMHDFVSSLRGVKWPISDASLLANTNTPEEWEKR